MKNTLKWFLALLLLAGIIFGASILYNNLSDKYKMDTPEEQSEETFAAPDFKALDNDGKTVKLSDYKGKPIVLNFWATWCHFCKEEMPDFNKAYKNYPEVQFFMLNATDGVSETLEKAKSYVKKESFEFDVFFDTKLEGVNAYSVNGFPATFFINSKGELVARASGMISYESLENGIEMITKEG